MNLRRKATGSRINIPKPPLQKRVDELSNINKRLASYLADEQIRVPLLADSHAALDFTLRIPQHRDEPYGALRIIGVQHACACQEGDSTSVISDDYTKPSIDNDNVSITVVNESPFLQQTYKHTSISVYDMRSSKPAPRMVGATRQHDNRRMIDMLFKPAEVPGAAIGLHELLTKNAFKLDVMKAKELAFRLASAVLLLLSLRLPGDTLKWKNPKILIDVEKDVGSCDLYIIPRVRRDEDSSEEQLRTNAVISIISRDISLTLLGIRLCEIGFGYTLKEARQRDSSLPPELDKGESLIRDIRTARQLLAQGRIREEFGHKYEAVVSACVNQQYREVKTGEVKDLNVGDASFFEIATVLILMPLHREYRMISG